MTYQIISREAIRARARRHFAEGLGRDDHDMNPGSAAIEDFHKEWDLCAAMAKREHGAQKRNRAAA